MNRDDIIRMAREAGIPESENEGVFIANSDDLGRLIAAEREACASICDAEAKEWVEMRAWADDFANELAKAIRARGQDV